MKKTVACLVVVLLAATLFAGCSIVQSPALGLLYTDVEAPVAATSNPNAAKVGTAMCESILWLIAVGDASIETAARSGQITKIHHVDHYSRSILGIYGVYEVRVYGE